MNTTPLTPHRTLAADLLRRLGEELDLSPEDVALNADDAVCLSMKDGYSFFLLFQPEVPALDLHADLGPLSPGRLTEQYADMLQGNMLFSATDGYCLGLDAQTGRANLNARLELEGLAYSAFRNRVEHFVRICERWKERLCRPPQTDFANGTELSTGLRV